jgi:hypothetical protein
VGFHSQTLIRALCAATRRSLTGTRELPGSSRIQGTTTGSCNYTFAKPVPWTVRRCIHHNVLYLWHVCSLVRRVFRSDVRHVIHIQSCIRRRLARRQLKGLKAEVGHSSDPVRSSGTNHVPIMPPASGSPQTRLAHGNLIVPDVDHLPWPPTVVNSDVPATHDRKPPFLTTLTIHC